MRKYERGQILLIIVLVMTIVFTISLSLSTRSISDIRTSTEQENSQRAFSAAEAGIEKAMQGDGSSGIFVNNTSFQTSIATVSGITLLLNNGAPILKDDASDLWLSLYPGYTSPWDGNVTIYWGNSSDVCNANETLNSRAALEIVLISGTKTDPQVAHYPVDPCIPPAPDRASANNFEVVPAGGGTVNGRSFAFKKTIEVTSGLLMRIIPLYASTTVGIVGCDALNANCNPLPAQGKIVTSVGTSDNTQRKIIGFQENPKLPVQIFPFLIFSPK